MLANPTQEFDVAVIGGGSAGYAAARTCAAGGLRVAVVEGGAEVGGLCILRGCMPTKALLYSAEIAHLARHAPTWGIRAESVTVDYGAVMERKNRMIQGFADYRRGQLSDGRFALIRASARFLDPHTLRLSDGGTLSARNFVLATGSTISPPPLESLGKAGYLTSDDALALKAAPASLVVLGGGAIALEFAQFFSRMGSKVTLIQRSPQLLRDEDPETAESIQDALAREGIVIHTGTQLLGAERGGVGKRIRFGKAGGEFQVDAEEILVALGRQPNIEGLALEKAGVETPQGRIGVDDRMLTSAPHIYAAGDCVGLYEIVHIAIQQGETAAANILGRDRRMDYRLISSIVFTDPQVARVGLTAKEATARGIPHLSASYPFNDHGKSMIMEALDGFVRLLAHSETGEIIGGACVGPVGGELIHIIVAAMHKRMTVHELAAMPHYHPTLAEIWSYPAEELADAIPTP